MNTIARQDALLRGLRRSGATTVEAMAAEAQVSRRTILRDIGALRDQGHMILTECGRGGGVRLDPRSVEKRARLSASEVFALIVTVAAAQAAGALPFASLADAGLAKIEGALPPEAVRDLRRLLDGLHVGRLSPLQDLSGMGAMDPALLPAFETGFLDRRLLRFAYRDAKGRETMREVEPQAMLVLPPLWYLVAWDPGREGFRHFRMDRIAAPEVVEETRFARRHVPFEDDVCPFRELERRRA